MTKETNQPGIFHPNNPFKNAKGIRPTQQLKPKNDKGFLLP